MGTKNGKRPSAEALAPGSDEDWDQIGRELRIVDPDARMRFLRAARATVVLYETEDLEASVRRHLAVVSDDDRSN